MLPEASNQELNKIIVAGAIAMLSLAIAIVLFVLYYQRRVIRHQQEIKRINDEKQLELMQASIQGEEEERMRIAAELHDDVGATLSSIRLYLHSAEKTDNKVAMIQQSKELLDQSIGKIRSISHRLQPAMLLQLGLQASLESFATMINKTGNVKMSYTGISQLPKLNDSVALSLYRIVQECTNNIIKHANATTIAVESEVTKDQLQVLMLYNGHGLTNNMYTENLHKKGAIGLKNIANRVKTINGTISFEKADNGMFRIIIQKPLNENL